MRDNKKPLLFMLAVTIFFAGAILVTELPKLATLFMFLAVVASTVDGFFIGKCTYLPKLNLNMDLNAEAQKTNMELTEKIKVLTTNNTNLNLDLAKLKAEITALKTPLPIEEVPVAPKDEAKSAKKPKKKSK